MARFGCRPPAPSPHAVPPGPHRSWVRYAHRCSRQLSGMRYAVPSRPRLLALCPMPRERNGIPPDQSSAEGHTTPLCRSRYLQPVVECGYVRHWAPRRACQPAGCCIPGKGVLWHRNGREPRLAVRNSCNDIHRLALDSPSHLRSLDRFGMVRVTRGHQGSNQAGQGHTCQQSHTAHQRAHNLFSDDLTIQSNAQRFGKDPEEEQ